MAIDLSTLILRVRSRLSDIPIEILDDAQIYQDLELASDFLNLVLRDTTTDAQRSSCLITLGAYYSYINYTSIAEQRLGNFPQASYIRMKALLNIAYSFIQPLARVPLNSDLTINEKAMANAGGIAFGLTDTVIGD